MPSAEVSTRLAAGTVEELHLDLRPEHLAELRQLLRRHVPGIQVWAYGSRVTGGAHGGSDLDLVLRQPADLSRRSAVLPELREALQQSRLPMLVDVHDWAELPASFHREIERCHVVIEPGR
jgi:predicted nucleotidyltransferase